MITNMKNKILNCLSVLTVIAAILTGFTVSVSAGNDGLIGANIKDGVLLGYYGDGGDIKIPDTVTVIDGDAFLNNDNITSVTIPGSVQVIGYHAFDGCTDLERVIFEAPTDGADMIIRLDAFANCPKLTECEIPAVATYVTANVFKGCTSMEKIKVHPENPYYFTDENGVMFGPWVNEGVPQYDDPNLTLTAYPSGRIGAYTVPESVNGRTVNRIWASAFKKAEKLTDIDIPETVKIIGGNAFEQTGLTYVTIPDTVESIGSGAFEDCTKLTYAKLPDNMTSIPHSMFKGCTSLSSIGFPKAANNIEMYAFADCKSLTNLILPNGIVNITLAAFEGCTNLQRVVIPPIVTGFPSDDTLGAYDLFPDSPRNLTVYVQKGSNGERWAVNNVEDWGYKYEVLDDVSNLDSINPGSFYLINLSKKVKVEGTFPINSVLSAEEIYSGDEYNAFKAKADNGALSVYSISATPDIKDGEYTVSIGIPDGYSKNARLYFYDNGEVTEISSSQVSKTFTVQMENLGYFAVIDSSISDGNNDEVTSVTLNKTSAAMKKGDKLQLSATVLPQTAADKSVKWESSDSAVASVDSKGAVTAVSSGTAKITATEVNGISAYCTVTVSDSQAPSNDKIEAIIILPRELFITTDISVTLWILNQNKKGGKYHGRNLRNRENEILFMDLRTWTENPVKGEGKKKVLLSNEQIQRAANIYHTCQNEGTDGTDYAVPELYRSVGIDEIEENSYSLVSSKYIEFIDHDLDIDFDKEMNRIREEMKEILALEKQSQKALEDAFRGIGYGIE